MLESALIGVALDVQVNPAVVVETVGTLVAGKSFLRRRCSFLGSGSHFEVTAGHRQNDHYGDQHSKKSIGNLYISQSE